MQYLQPFLKQVLPAHNHRILCSATDIANCVEILLEQYSVSQVKKAEVLMLSLITPLLALQLMLRLFLNAM